MEASADSTHSTDQTAQHPLRIQIMPLRSIGYDLGKFLQPASVTRPLFTDHFYRCLPLMSANTAGWTLYNPFAFTVQWKNGGSPADIVIECDQPDWVTSWFGYGTFTIQPGFMVRTSPGINLWVRPVPNHYKPPVLTLEGMVETDWLNGTFTLNFMMRMPLVKIRYEVGEPLVQFVPYPREFIEQFDAEIVRQGEDYDELMERHAAWNRVRKDDIASRAPLAQHYMRGLDVDGTPHPEHKRAFKVPPFRQDDLTSSPTSTPTSESDA